MRDIDRIIQDLARACPQWRVEQLQVRHPGADDDGLWFFSHPSCPDELQLESPSGQCPFVLESGRERARADTVEDAVEWIMRRLAPTQR